MSFLRGSLNYVWCTTSMLGKGATGAVYQGVNKHNGEPVAVKTFNQLSHMRPQEVQMREFEVLKKVKHENIVKLLAIEDDQEGRGKVIVMELCTGGSLFNILDDPENTYGLSEVEFLLVLEHLSAGMRHLRDNNLVHRDLKPGNIMKFTSEDGQTIYKLTDFGAARELQDNQPFASLYGTEEYLHPDMYERAVLRKSVTRSFTANVDLWSIGVTLYHVATGNLPFRPYGGRKNKETMHLITTKKAQGVIAGTQLSENGPIEWARQLPAHCQLTAGLKFLVIPLLAGLLEDNQTRMWSFERFFTEVRNILSKRVLHVFYMNRVSRIEVFLEPDNTLCNLKELIQQQTDVSPENQLLLLNGEFFETKVGTNTTIRGYPETTVENSITLYCIENNNVALGSELELPKFPVFPSAVSVENDASLAKVGSSVGHEIKRRIEAYSMKDFLVKQGIDQFTNMLKAILTKLLHKVEYLKELSITVVDLAEIIESVATKQDEYYNESKLILKEVIKLKMDFDKVVDPVRQLHEKSVTDEMLTREWQNATRNIRCPCRTKANAKAKTAVERLRDSWQHLLRDRATRSLTYNDEQFHALEKIKIAETGKRLKGLLVDDVKPAIDMIAESVADWYKMGQANFVQAQILEKDVANFENNLYEIKETLSRIKNDLKTDINNRKKVNVTCAKDSCVTNGSSKIDLSTIFALQAELQTILGQNTELIENLRQVNLGGEDTFISIDHHGRL